RSEVQAFVEFFMENVSEACEKVGYVRLPPQIIDQGFQNIDIRALGTHFVTDKGESRSGPLADNFVPSNLTE
ncbi:MAG: phosphate-binding protein, partial [Planctomycetota bacterium]